MARIKIRPVDLNKEVAEFERKLARGLDGVAQFQDAPPGATARTPIFRLEQTTLYHYPSTRVDAALAPTLIVYALVNRPYMADLQEGRSLVAGLLAQGLDLYLLDWGDIDASDRHLSLDDYLNRYLRASIEHICAKHGISRINLIGICQGGTFSACYAALYPEQVKNLITTVTPIDFHTEHDMLSHLLKHLDLQLLADNFGILSGDVLNSLFLALKPFRLTQQKYVEMARNLDNREATALFMRMEKWIFDSPALAGRALLEFAEQFYRRNALISDGVEIGGRKVELKNIMMPVLNIFAREDHLVPRASSQALARVVGTHDYTEVELPGGHIGMYVSSQAGQRVPVTIGEWLRARC